ncbi:MAG TPA: hypothetical protein VEJ38_12545 [Candidatus Acidoferrales bacterium]|nr:hypothetical protein [Candidatus Acidoferrales bacterium]
MIPLRPAIIAAIALGCAATLGAQTRMPDWSGQWEIVGATPNASGGMVQPLDEVLKTMQWQPPNNPQTQATVNLFHGFIQKYVDAVRSGTDPGGISGPTCTFGFPAVMLDSPLMFEVLPTPKETVLIFSGREVRHVYTDGRQHTPKDDLWATPWGDSIGHWEGETLVVDTIAVKAPFRNIPPGMIPIFAIGAEIEEEVITILSPQAQFIERIRMPDKDHLEDQMTVIDPTNLTAPWHLSRTYRRVAHIHRMVYEDCEGEDRNPVVNGHYTLTPPPSSPPPPLPPTPKSPEGHSR